MSFTPLRPQETLTAGGHFTAGEMNVAGCEEREVATARVLCVEVLEPIRERFACGLHVTSARRSEEHNRDVGGVPTSFHLFDAGRGAADFIPLGCSFTEVFDWIRLESGLPVDQVILEHSRETGEPQCIHVQIDIENMPRRQAYIGITHGAQAKLQKKYQRVEFRMPAQGAPNA